MVYLLCGFHFKVHDCEVVDEVAVWIECANIRQRCCVVLVLSHVNTVWP